MNFPDFLKFNTVVKSIILKLEGGLGNQFYQYATAYSFSEKYGVPLVVVERLDSPLDLRRHNHLGLFNCQFTPATPIQRALVHLIFVKKFSIGKISRRFLTRFFSFSLISDPENGFYPNLLENRSGRLILRGYWQSFKYFDSIRENLIHKFSLIHSPQDFRNIEMLEKIESQNSVAIHVRRGDYQNVPFFKENFGLCSLEYYNKSVEYISERISNPQFFVFSDDPDWVKENLEINQPIFFINHNIGRDFEDFRLMRSCKHFIIANSSFSWWAAYLGSDPDKIVVSPSKWFRNDPMPFEDRIPQSWIRI